MHNITYDRNGKEQGEFSKRKGISGQNLHLDDGSLKTIAGDNASVIGSGEALDKPD